MIDWIASLDAGKLIRILAIDPYKRTHARRSEIILAVHFMRLKRLLDFHFHPKRGVGAYIYLVAIF